MFKQIKFLALFLIIASLSFSQETLLSPDEFLPHKLGENFTPHHLLVDYFKYVAANSDLVKLTEYGRTNEERPLLLAAVSSKKNMDNLESIRQNNLRRAGLLEGQVDETQAIAIVWLGFSVHGNEAAGSESSMQVLYELANPSNKKTKNWLENTVVLLDPSVNPDGYSRYTHWYRRVNALKPDPSPASMEHHEPWPGGRVNHYLFDLNRDWAWATQVETRQRLKVYQQWMPHIVADLHEQFLNDPYYFAPAAQPYHTYITDWQSDFQVEIGKNHAKYFDANGWLYFTKEVFDLFYPSYGDTYPTFNGAIGMTYEQGGHSRAGRAVLMENGDTLTLKDRVDHHKTTALSTVEVASKNAERITKQFEEYFKNGKKKPPGTYKTFIIKSTNSPQKIQSLCRLLDRHKIKYGRLGSLRSVTAYNYATGKESKHDISEFDLVISAFQPKGVLTQVLFEPQSKLVDSLTYDITAWSLPYAYGLEAYATKQKVEVSQPFNFEKYKNNLKAVAKPYAYVAVWKSLQNEKFLSVLLQKDIKVRYAQEGFEIANQRFAAGTLVITRADNRKIKNFDKIVREVSQKVEQEITAVQSGFVTSGNDFGSDKMTFITKPKIAVLSGEKTFPNSFGQVWYYFEQDLGYLVSLIDANDLKRIALDDYNLLILPEGRYGFNDATLEKLNNWISGGGRLIAIGSANRSLEDKKGFNLTKFAKKTEKTDAEKAEEEEALGKRKAAYHDRERSFIPESIPGAIYKIKMDNTHPLGFGMPDYYFSLKTSSRRYDLLKNTWNVGYIDEHPLIEDFVGYRLRERLKNSLVFAVQNKGRGSVTYLIDNPLYRAFWVEGKFLFGNAVFFVGQ